MKLFCKIQAYIKDTDGVTGIEYGFLVGGIALAMLTGITFFADEFNAMQVTISDYMQSRL